MRIIFMGTPDFAVPSLEILLHNKFNVVAVVTAPDKAAGRGQQLQQSSVKKIALEKGLPLLQPEKLKDEQFLNQLAEFKADLQIVVAFRMLPEAVWNMPPLGTYNLHASLLPKYRGAAPINWAIINGDKKTGVTIFKLQHQIDTGKILLTDEVQISENMTAGELHDILMKRGATLLLDAVTMIDKYSEGNMPLPFKNQDESEVSHAPKIFKETCRINWSESAENINNLIRGLSPYPGAFTEISNSSGRHVLKIYSAQAEATDSGLPIGSLICDGKSFLKISCKDGLLNVLDLQLQGRKRMKTTEFLRGFKLGETTVIL